MRKLIKLSLLLSYVKDGIQDPPVVNEMIINEPITVKVLDYEIMGTMKEYKPIMHALKDKYMSVKEIHELYYNESTGKHDRGLKTIYRYIEKLMELELVIEVGQRMTQGSRAVETLYGPAAKAFFYEGPEVMDRWDSEEGRAELESISKLVSSLMGKKIDPEEFRTFALDYLTEQDEKSSELIRHINEDPDLLDVIKAIPSGYLGKVIFMATDMSILWRRLNKE